MSNQRVFLEPHDPRWAEEFARESSLVANAMGDLLAAIDHIGSTAIPGISAKPIIDMMAAVNDAALLDERSPRLEALGYEVMGEFGIPGRRYFRKDNAAGTRTHQIHAFQADSPQIQRHVAFRDFLRAHPDCAQQYDALKQRLAALFPNDIAGYTEGKDEFIKEMDARAAEWRMSKLDESVMKFVAEFTGAKRQQLTPATTLFGDLSVDGADGWELIEAFGKTFQVDLAAFRADRHFGPEGVSIFAPVALLWSIIRWPFRKKQSPEEGASLKAIHIGDLIAAAREQRWTL